jgi:hypothetical protein
MLYLKLSPRSAAKEARVNPTLADSLFNTKPSDTLCDWNWSVQRSGHWNTLDSRLGQRHCLSRAADAYLFLIVEKWQHEVWMVCCAVSCIRNITEIWRHVAEFVQSYQMVQSPHINFIAMSCHVMLYCVMSCHVMSCHVKLCYVSNKGT